MRYTTFILLMAFVPTALVLKCCATFLMLSTSSSLILRHQNWVSTRSLLLLLGRASSKKNEISLQIALFLHSSSHSKKEGKKKKQPSSKKAVSLKFPPAKEMRSDMEKLDKKKKKKEACFSRNRHEGKNPIWSRGCKRS